MIYKYNMDLHTHSEFSCDSESKIRSMCVAAIKMGLKYLAITDHVDHNINDYGFNYYKVEAYFTEFTKCKDEFSNEITLLSGMEFSEPQLYPKQLERLKKYGYDMVIGSIHWIGDYFIGQRNITQFLTRDEIEKRYLESTVEMVKMGGFDVIGHIDRLKVAIGPIESIDEYIDEILLNTVKNDIAIEINTRSIRKGFNEIMPSPSILEKYIEYGGNKIIIGSDAHSPEEIGADYDKILTDKEVLIKDKIGVYESGVFRRY